MRPHISLLLQSGQGWYDDQHIIWSYLMDASTVSRTRRKKWKETRASQRCSETAESGQQSIHCKQNLPATLTQDYELF